MLGDTFVLPHSGGDITCSKIKEEGYSSEYLYKDSTTQVVVKVRHSKTKTSEGNGSKDRHNVEIVETTFATETVPEFSRKVYFVMESLPSDTDVEMMDALADWAIASTNANLDALMGWES